MWHKWGGGGVLSASTIVEMDSRVVAGVSTNYDLLMLQ